MIFNSPVGGQIQTHIDARTYRATHTDTYTHAHTHTHTHAHTHAHARTHTLTSRTKAILTNKAHAWFKKCFVGIL